MCGPKCRCQKCYELHGSGPMVTNKMTNTDTPRTDACPHCGCQTKDPFGFSMTIHDVDLCKARKINREMKPTTDTPRTDICPHCRSMDITPLPTALREAMIKADNYSQELTHTQKNLRAASMERDRLREKSDELKAEVERLRANLCRAIELVGMALWEVEESGQHRRKIRAELDQLKATLNPDKK